MFFPLNFLLQRAKALCLAFMASELTCPECRMTRKSECIVGHKLSFLSEINLIHQEKAKSTTVRDSTFGYRTLKLPSALNFFNNH